ncbi:MAG: hypothetical protein L6R36_006661 [Xanthoria steineri]|nr:MAG: hypothetical protein L6R36_006661 [Xanthoria steineri]
MRRYVLTHPIPIYAIVFHLAHNHRSLEIKYYPQNRSSGTVIQDGMARRKEGLMAFVEAGELPCRPVDTPALHRFSCDDRSVPSLSLLTV